MIFTYWDVVSVILSFLATHLRATLCGLLGGLLDDSQRILDERDVGQSRAVESRPQLEPLLKRFLVILI
jgi:hypothetical protein